LATAAAVNAQTPRCYERQGLLTAPDRSPAGYRIYPPAAVGRIRFIKRAQELGFSLATIHVLLDMAKGGPDNCDQVRTLAAEKDDLRQRLTDLKSIHDSLTRLVGTCNRPRDERECPILQAIGADEPAQAQPAFSVELLVAPGCPHAAAARAVLSSCLAELGLEVPIRERVGPHPSPTVLINGRDVMTGVVGVPAVPACRLDQPTAERITAALGSISTSPATPGEIAEQLVMATNLVAHHVKVLSESGLVTRTRSEGDRRRTYLQLRPETLDLLAPPHLAADRVVFVCTHNSARSQLAAALWRERTGRPVASAGTNPVTRVHPRAVRIGCRHGLAMDPTATAHVDDVARPGDLLIAVCDNAHET
jgi:DNA-binding transcriptional MerR regulator/predicted protein tyrosine phosphatase